MPRTDQSRVTASVIFKDATVDLGTFEDRKGGASDSGSVVGNRGGMGPREAHGGKAEPAPVTIARVRDDASRLWEKKLRQNVGRMKITIKEQGLDDEGNEVVGDLTTWTGKVKMVTTTDRSEEGNAIEYVEIESIVETVS